MNNVYSKGLILSLGLHASLLSFFYFDYDNFKKSESSITEIIILSSDDSFAPDKKNNNGKNDEKTSVDQEKIHNEKKKINKSTTLSELKINHKNNNFQFEANIQPNAFKKENHSENNKSNKNILSELKSNKEFMKKKVEKLSGRSSSKKIFQSSASYRIGSENNPHPKYPVLARKKGWQGRVLIQANIDKVGNVKFIKVLESSGFKVLDDVSVETLKSWKFKPAMLGNKFVDDTVNIPVKFVLTN